MIVPSTTLYSTLSISMLSKLLESRNHRPPLSCAWMLQGSSLSEIEPLGEEGQPPRSALVQALQARIRSLEQELRESDNTHKLRCLLLLLHVLLLSWSALPQGWCLSISFGHKEMVEPSRSACPSLHDCQLLLPTLAT